MRLPGRQEGAVQQKVSVDPGVYKQRGQAIGGAFDVVQGVAAEWAQKKADEANREAVLAMSNKEIELKENYGGQTTFTHKEVEAMGEKVPEEFKEYKWIDSHGDSQSKPRNDVPAEEILPGHRKRILEEEAKLRSELLTGSGRKKEFLSRQQEIINNQYVGELGTAQQAREAKLLSKYDFQIANAEVNGSYDLAISLVDGHPTMDMSEKKQEKTRLHQEEEKRLLFRLKNAELYNPDGSMDRDAAQRLLPQLRGQLQRLKSPQYGRDDQGERLNSLTKPQRETEISSLQSLVDGVQSSLVGDADNTKAAAYVGFYQAVDEGTPLPDLLNMADQMAVSLGLSGSQIKSLRDYAKEGAIYDPKVVAKLNNLADMDPASFIKHWEKQGTMYAMHMTPDMYGALQSRYEDNKLGRTEGLSDAAYTTQLIKASGIDTKGDPDDKNVIAANRAIADFRAWSTKLIKEAEATAGRQLTGEERRAKIREARDSTLTPQLVSDPEKYVTNYEGINDKATSQTAPATALAQIRTYILETEGRSITTDEATELYADIMVRAHNAEKEKAKQLKEEREAEEDAQQAIDNARVHKRLSAPEAIGGA